MFVLLENEHCSANNNPGTDHESHNERKQQSEPEDPCITAPRVNEPKFDSPCYNGGSCINTTQQRYSCLCPPGFAGPLCEVNIDDCADHQCQNGAQCVDGINSYRCVCRDPTTTGEYCEQFSPSNQSPGSPLALPMVASPSQAVAAIYQPMTTTTTPTTTSATAALTYIADSHMDAPRRGFRSDAIDEEPIYARNVDEHRRATTSERPHANNTISAPNGEVFSAVAASCKRVTQRRYHRDGNGCQSVRMLKMSECLGTCGLAPELNAATCCQPSKVKRRRIRMLCSDGASYVKNIELVKRCACSTECSSSTTEMNAVQSSNIGPFASFGHTGTNAGESLPDDHSYEITRVDAVD